MNEKEDRSYWLSTLLRIAEPVLTNLAKRQLRTAMPVEIGGEADRSPYSHLEALGRTLVGLAPWLELSQHPEEERELVESYRELARQALDSATDPDSPDRMNFAEGGQPIVDTAFLAQALLRAPRELWEKLEPRVQANVVRSLRETRTGRKPHFNNWLLFSAMTETALRMTGAEDWDHMRIDYALRQHEAWYVGDGAYSDGPHFHWDYYNSFVIQPMLLDILSAVRSEHPEWDGMAASVSERAQRYAEVLERLIAPDGTYPAIGRSLTYRFGAFQPLAQLALQGSLPASVSPAQARCALTAVIRRTMEAPGNFDDAGWLRIGLYGSQPALAESYISTGSLYLCTAGLLPLGLPAEDPFWSGEPQAWTSRKLWSGENVPADHAYSR
ncbi:DUF2264 domain-containing protein [Paenibacillus puerhi]|uniref:DUF2264 domain-containing protein n=1 Tax=Paenibacillus puerhi TaxID=2692622 RepID=UPI00135BD88A|nr:DUF2264 domain-containing protein [Paenibacillus puerhi]